MQRLGASSSRDMTGPVTLTVASALVAVGATAGAALFPMRSAIDVLLAWVLVASTIVVARLVGIRLLEAATEEKQKKQQEEQQE